METDKLKMNAVLQKSQPVPFQNVNIMEDKENQINYYRLKEPKRCDNYAMYDSDQITDDILIWIAYYIIIIMKMLSFLNFTIILWLSRRHILNIQAKDHKYLQLTLK